MSEKIIDEVMGLVGKYGSAVESTVTGNPENHSLYSDENSAYEAIRAKLREVLERKPLTNEQIDDLHGEANRGFDIESDAYLKAFRDAERAHGIGS